MSISTETKVQDRIFASLTRGSEDACLLFVLKIKFWSCMIDIHSQNNLYSLFQRPLMD